MGSVIIFYRNGTYKIVKVADKIFIGKDILYVNVFKRNDNRTIYNVIYRDGKFGYNYIKRFAVTGATRDREYDLTKGTENSRVLYFSANPNGEAETVKVILKPKPRQKLLVFGKNFSEIAIKGRGSQGNILTKAEVHKISLKQKGSSTLGGREVWFDWDVLRLNYDGRGEELGEFHSNDQILVILPNGDFYVTNFDLAVTAGQYHGHREIPAEQDMDCRIIRRRSEILLYQTIPAGGKHPEAEFPRRESEEPLDVAYG